LSAIPASNWLRYCGKVFQNHEQVELASTCLIETD
jgi:hypothetical protein